MVTFINRKSVELLKMSALSSYEIGKKLLNETFSEMQRDPLFMKYRIQYRDPLALQSKLREVFVDKITNKAKSLGINLSNTTLEQLKEKIKVENKNNQLNVIFDKVRVPTYLLQDIENSLSNLKVNPQPQKEVDIKQVTKNNNQTNQNISNNELIKELEQKINLIKQSYGVSVDYEIKTKDIDGIKIPYVEVKNVSGWNPRQYIDRKVKEAYGDNAYYIIREWFRDGEVDLYVYNPKELERIKEEVVSRYSYIASKIAEAVGDPKLKEQILNQIKNTFYWYSSSEGDVMLLGVRRHPAYILEDYYRKYSKQIEEKYGKSGANSLWWKIRNIKMSDFRAPVIKGKSMIIRLPDLRRIDLKTYLQSQINTAITGKIDEIGKNIKDPIKRLELSFEKQKLLGGLEYYSITKNNDRVYVRARYKGGKEKEWVYPVEDIAGRKVLLGLESPYKVVQDIEKEIKETGDLSKLFDLKEAYETAKEWKVVRDVDRFSGGYRYEYYLERRDRDLWDNVDKWDIIREHKEIAEISENLAKKFAEVDTLKELDNLAKSSYNLLISNAISRVKNWGILDYSWKDNVLKLKKLDELIPDDGNYKNIDLDLINKLKVDIVQDFINDAIQNYREADSEKAKALRKRVKELLNKANQSKNFADYMHYLTKAEKVNKKLAQLNPDLAYSESEIKLISSASLIEKVDAFNQTKSVDEKKKLLKEIKQLPQSKLLLDEKQLNNLESALDSLKADGVKKEQTKQNKADLLREQEKMTREFLDNYNKFASDALKKTFQVEAVNTKEGPKLLITKYNTNLTQNSIKKDPLSSLKIKEEIESLLKDNFTENFESVGKISMSSEQIKRQISIAESSKNYGFFDVLIDIGEGANEIGNALGGAIEFIGLKTSEGVKKMNKDFVKMTKDLTNIDLEEQSKNKPFETPFEKVLKIALNSHIITEAGTSFGRGFTEASFQAVGGSLTLMGVTGKSIKEKGVKETGKMLATNFKTGLKEFVKEVKENPVETISYSLGQGLFFGGVAPKLGKLGKALDVMDDTTDLAYGYGIFQFAGKPIKVVGKTLEESVNFIKEIKELSKVEALPVLDVKDIEVKGKSFKEGEKTYELTIEGKPKVKVTTSETLKSELLSGLLKDIENRINVALEDLKISLKTEGKVKTETEQEGNKIKVKTTYTLKHPSTNKEVKLNEVEKTFNIKKVEKELADGLKVYDIKLVEDKKPVVKIFKGENGKVESYAIKETEGFEIRGASKGEEDIFKVRKYNVLEMAFNGKVFKEIKKTGGHAGKFLKKESGDLDLIFAEKNPFGITYNKAKPLKFEEVKEGVDIIKPKKTDSLSVKGFEKLIEKQLNSKLESLKLESVTKTNAKQEVKQETKTKTEGKLKLEDKLLLKDDSKIEDKLKELFETKMENKLKEEKVKSKLESVKTKTTKAKVKAKVGLSQKEKQMFDLNQVTEEMFKMLQRPIELEKLSLKQKVTAKLKQKAVAKQTQKLVTKQEQKLKLEQKLKQESKVESKGKPDGNPFKFDFDLKLEPPKIDMKEEVKEEPTKKKKKIEVKTESKGTQLEKLEEVFKISLKGFDFKLEEPTNKKKKKKSRKKKKKVLELNIAF